jgi:hypothetical protein
VGAGEARRAVWAGVRAGDAGGGDPCAGARVWWRGDVCEELRNRLRPSFRGLKAQIASASRAHFTGGAWQGCAVVVARAAVGARGVGCAGGKGMRGEKL